MNCPCCKEPVHDSNISCPHCQIPLGFPNVRAAENTAEASELERRYLKAVDDAELAGTHVEAVAFELAASKSHVIIAKKWGAVRRTVEHDRPLFKNFYRQVIEDGRQPEDNDYDRQRRAVDASFFPYYEDKIVFGALSLDGKGDSSYGDCHFQFKENSISHRTSLFHANTLVFCLNKKLTIGSPIPLGFRSTWNRRGQLAFAKYHSQLKPGMSHADFAGVLLNTAAGKGTADADFVEAHIYGEVHLSNVDAFWGVRPKSKPDRIIADRLKRLLTEKGVSSVTFV